MKVPSFSDFMTGGFVLCTLFVAVLVVRQEFFTPDPLHATNIPNWRFLLWGGEHKGLSDAPVKFIEFSDFQCPFCKKLEPWLKDLLKKYPDKIEFIWHDFPLQAHPQALEAAKAAGCADEQNDFWDYHDLLYQNQASFKRQPWDSLAEIAGIKDLKAFNRCMKDTTVNEVIEKDIRIGQRIGVQGTPTLVINGQMISGVLPESQLGQLVKKALQN